MTAVEISAGAGHREVEVDAPATPGVQALTRGVQLLERRLLVEDRHDDADALAHHRKLHQRFSAKPVTSTMPVAATCARR